MTREIIDVNKNYGLIFTGGGTKGSYEIGAWKALNELNIKITAVAGTSIGAINGALFAQGDFQMAYDIWSNAKAENFIESESNMVTMLLTAIKDGGLDVSPLRSMMDEYFDEEKIRNSEIDFGLVTYSLSDVKPVMLMKKDIPKGKLNDFIMASASFPLFKPAMIDGKKYIDGAVYDNVPVQLLEKTGIKDIIVIHISGIGVDRNYNAKQLGLDSLYTIKNSSKLSGTLEFDNKKINDGITLGYLDTLKAFGKLNGAKYFLANSLEDYENSKVLFPMKDDELLRLLDTIQSDSESKERKSKFSLIKNLYDYTTEKLTLKSVIQACLEITAELFEIETLAIYTGEELYDKVVLAYKTIKEDIEYIQSKKTISGMYKSMDFNNINRKNLAAYFISLSEKDDTSKKYLQLFLPKVYISYLFLKFMSKRDSRI